MFRYIVGMAEHRKQISYDLSHAAKQLNIHFIKLMLYPTSENKDHWKDEIFAFINVVSKLKGSNKYPNNRFILESIQHQNDIVDNLICIVKDRYSNLTPSEISDQIILNKLIQYQTWLAGKLASEGKVTQSEVFDKLENLIKEGEE